MLTPHRGQHGSPHRRKESHLSTRRWRKGLDGQGLVEYSLILLLVVLAIMTSLAVLGPFVSRLLDQAVNAFPA